MRRLEAGSRRHILVTSTPNRDSVMNHPILILAHSVRALWLPVRHSLQARRLAGLSLSRRVVRIDKTLIVVGDVLTGVAQMLHVGLGGRGKWRAGSQGVLMTRRFQTDQIACRQGSEQLGVSESPFGTELWVQSTEKLGWLLEGKS